MYAGTSGFAYAAWKPGFYPAKLPANQFLKHYGERLNCVEMAPQFRVNAIGQPGLVAKLKGIAQPFRQQRQLIPQQADVAFQLGGN